MMNLTVFGVQCRRCMVVVGISKNNLQKEVVYCMKCSKELLKLIKKEKKNGKLD